MRKVFKLFDPPMGSPSGIGLYTALPQEELLRVATLLYFLEKHGIEVRRANLSTKPQAFLETPELMDKLMEVGDEYLPALYDEDGLLLTGRYPTNEEVADWYGLPELKEKLPELPDEAFAALWEEAALWGSCGSGGCGGGCGGCSGCG